MLLIPRSAQYRKTLGSRDGTVHTLTQKGVRRSLTFQVSYALSGFENAGGNGGNVGAALVSADQDLGVGALDNARPQRYFGPSLLDRTLHGDLPSSSTHCGFRSVR
jgi:hypothetical protein